MPRDQYRKGRDKDVLRPGHNPHKEPTRSQIDNIPWVYCVYDEDGRRASEVQFRQREDAECIASELKAKDNLSYFVKAEKARPISQFRGRPEDPNLLTIGERMENLRFEAGLLLYDLKKDDRAAYGLIEHLEDIADPSAEVSALLVEHKPREDSWTPIYKVGDVKDELVKIRDAFAASGLVDECFVATLDELQRWIVNL